MRLAELQTQMQNAMLNDTDFADNNVAQPPRGKPAQGFAVYKNGYALRLTEFLANDYEMLRQYLGEVRFNAMAADYIASNPSHHANARWYSSKLPEFLTTFPNAPPELSELAELERALRDAFDAPEAQIVAPDFLSRIAPESVHLLRFNFHPSLRFLNFQQNTTGLWSALRCGEAPPRPYHLEHPQHVMVWRQKNQSRMRMLGDDEQMALAAARDGADFGVICEMLALLDQSENAALKAATYLRGWLEADILMETCAVAAEK